MSLASATATAAMVALATVSSAAFAEPVGQASWKMRVVAHCSSKPSEAQIEQMRVYMKKLKRTVHRNWYPPKDGNACMVKFIIESTGVTNNVTMARGCEVWTEQAALRAVEKAAPYFPALEEPLRSYEVEFPFSYPFPDATISIVIDKPSETTKAP